MSKSIHGVRDIPSEVRLMILNLHFLGRCELREDLIEVFKWCCGYNKGDMSKVLWISSQNRTRNNGFRREIQV